MSAARAANVAENAADTARAPKPLAEILARSLDELAAAGRVDTACALAGLACAATRLSDIEQWKRFNALLHRWSAKAPEPAGTGSEETPARPRAPAEDDQRSKS